ncbi:MAG: hypothetical protein NVS1B4_04030 [Gemmatimonadaceae bacterium]
MFIEVVDLLRCLTPHAEDWLVAAVNRMEDRNVIDGRLGCPVCGASYPIVGGVAYFRVDPGSRDLRPPDPTRSADPSARALRIAALLALDDPRGMAVFAGEAGRAAPAVARLTGVHAVAVNPPSDPVVADAGVSAIHTSGGIPLAARSVRGVILGHGFVHPRAVEDAGRIVEPRGRLVAPVGCDMPMGVHELARDELEWVAERDDDCPALLRLTRAGDPLRSGPPAAIPPARDGA